MSYFPIDTCEEELINIGIRDIPMNDEQKKKVIYARHTTPHSEETKNQISQKQKERYHTIRELIKNVQNPVTELRIREIVLETIEKYKNNNQNS